MSDSESLKKDSSEKLSIPEQHVEMSDDSNDTSVKTSSQHGDIEQKKDGPIDSLIKSAKLKYDSVNAKPHHHPMLSHHQKNHDWRNPRSGLNRWKSHSMMC